GRGVDAEVRIPAEDAAAQALHEDVAPLERDDRARIAELDVVPRDHVELRTAVGERRAAQVPDRLDAEGRLVPRAGGEPDLVRARGGRGKVGRLLRRELVVGEGGARETALVEAVEDLAQPEELVWAPALAVGHEAVVVRIRLGEGDHPDED